MKIKQTTIAKVEETGIRDIGKYRYLLEYQMAGRAVIKRHPIKSIGCICRGRPYWELVARFDGAAWQILE